MYGAVIAKAAEEMRKPEVSLHESEDSVLTMDMH